MGLPVLFVLSYAGCSSVLVRVVAAQIFCLTCARVTASASVGGSAGKHARLTDKQVQTLLGRLPRLHRRDSLRREHARRSVLIPAVLKPIDVVAQTVAVSRVPLSHATRSLAPGRWPNPAAPHMSESDGRCSDRRRAKRYRLVRYFQEPMFAGCLISSPWPVKRGSMNSLRQPRGRDFTMACTSARIRT